jgi:hypothetical protein
MSDPTEGIRRVLQSEVNAVEGERAQLEAEHGQVWDTTQLSEDFEVLGFLAPFVIVRRKSDDKKGSLMFQHSPRFYFTFKEDS